MTLREEAALTDLPILTPSECAKLVEVEAKMTPGKWRDDPKNCSVLGPDGIEVLDYVFPANAIGIVALRNAAPRMLATIVAYEATIAELRKQLRAQDDDMKAWKESE